MPKVTKIEQQKKRADRYSISVDEEYAFALSANDLIASGLHAGLELTVEQLEEVKQSAGASRAYDQALNFISLRRRSQREVNDYLKKKDDYSAEVIESTVQRLASNGFIDDAEFARAWVHDRDNLRPRSKRLLEQELRQKGLDSAAIEIALADIDSESEVETAKRIAQKKLTHYADQRKLIAYLSRQGFSYDVIKQALEHIKVS